MLSLNCLNAGTNSIGKNYSALDSVTQDLLNVVQVLLSKANATIVSIHDAALNAFT